MKNHTYENSPKKPSFSVTSKYELITVLQHKNTTNHNVCKNVCTVITQSDNHALCNAGLHHNLLIFTGLYTTITQQISTDLNNRYII